MKAYNPRHWFSLIFSFHKSDAARQLIPAITGIALYTAALCYVHVKIAEINFVSTIVMHSLLGLAISLLLVFRTNTAYDRWWEGRKLLGELVNNSRNLMLKINAFLPAGQKAAKENFRILISNYAFALKEHLRGGFKPEELEDTPVLPLDVLKEYNHIPNRIAQQLYREAQRLCEQGIIPEEKLIVLNEELRSFTNIVGACERIRKTPIPYSYSIFIKRMIFLYVITLPFGLIPDLQWVSIPIVLLIFYAFAGLELIAEEIEDPFGKDYNDLPSDEIAMTIRKNLAEIMK